MTVISRARREAERHHLSDTVIGEALAVAGEMLEVLEVLAMYKRPLGVQVHHLECCRRRHREGEGGTMSDRTPVGAVSRDPALAPGPWRVAADRFVYAENGLFIGSMHPAAAARVAVAPEMLAVLVEKVRLTNEAYLEDEELRANHEAAKAVIAKAKGEAE